MPPENGSNVGVERALSVLDVFDRQHPALRVADVSRLSGLGTSTASRLLATLVNVGLLDRDELGLYRLGHKLVSLAGAALNTSAVFRESRGIAYEISCDLGLGTNVAELRDGHVFYLVNFDGLQAPRVGTLTGQENPLHATGLGKCLLMELEDNARSRLLGVGPYAAYTAHTITTDEALRLELEGVHTRGYATEREELALGRACVAAPIRDRSGKIVAALSISGPLSAIRIDEREGELAQRALEAADRVSSALGAVPRAMSTSSTAQHSMDGIPS